MAGRQNSHFGSDGYKELRLKEEAMKRTKNTYNSPVIERRKAKEKELFRLRDEDNKRKAREPRANKFHMPVGVSGKGKC